MINSRTYIQPGGLRVQECWTYLTGVPGSGRTVFEKLKAEYPEILVPYYKASRLECYRTKDLDAAMAASKMAHQKAELRNSG